MTKYKHATKYRQATITGHMPELEETLAKRETQGMQEKQGKEEMEGIRDRPLLHLERIQALLLDLSRSAW